MRRIGAQIAPFVALARHGAQPPHLSELTKQVGCNKRSALHRLLGGFWEM